MDSQLENTVINTTEEVLPIVAAASGNPDVQSAAALAPIAIQFLQSAQAIQAAGLMTEEQLAANFASVGQSIQATHQAWLNLNAKPVTTTVE